MWAKRAVITHEYLQTKRDVQALQAAETAQRANRSNELTKSLWAARVHIAR